MARTGQTNPNAQFAAAELKQKHENFLKKREALIERDQTSRMTFAKAREQAEETYKAYPTTKNYRRMKTAAIRAV